MRCDVLWCLPCVVARSVFIFIMYLNYHTCCCFVFFASSCSIAASCSCIKNEYFWWDVFKYSITVGYLICLHTMLDIIYYVQNNGKFILYLSAFRLSRNRYHTISLV